MPAGTTLERTPEVKTSTLENGGGALPSAEPPRTTESAGANNIRPTTVEQVRAIRIQYDNPVRLGMRDLAKEGKEQTIGGVTITFSESGPENKKAPEGFVFANFKSNGANGKEAEATVLLHKASGDLAKLNKEGSTVSISAFEQMAINPFFSKMREGLNDLEVQRAKQLSTKVSESLQPVKDGKAPHLAKLAKEVGAQGGSVNAGGVTVRSEEPSKEGAKGAIAKPEAVPAGHHRLTIEVRPSSQVGSTPETPRVLSLVVDDKDGTVQASTIGGKTAPEQQVNKFLLDAQNAAKLAPKANVPASASPESDLIKFLGACGKFANESARDGSYSQKLNGGTLNISKIGPNNEKAQPGRWFFSFKKPSGEAMVADIGADGDVKRMWNDKVPITVDTKNLYSFAQAVWHPQEQK
jgi:hypothetical protein